MTIIPLNEKNHANASTVKVTVKNKPSNFSVIKTFQIRTKNDFSSLNVIKTYSSKDIVVILNTNCEKTVIFAEFRTISIAFRQNPVFFDTRK